MAHLNHAGYAPKTVDHIHDVLSAVLRTAVKWGHLTDNPARGVDLPTLKTVKPKWALTIDQAVALLQTLPPLARTLCGLALLTGVRRGELFALRWQALDLDAGVLAVQEAVYEGKFGTPKTAAGLRSLPLAETPSTCSGRGVNGRSEQPPRTWCSRPGRGNRSPRTTCCGDGCSRPARSWAYRTPRG